MVVMVMMMMMMMMMMGCHYPQGINRSICNSLGSPCHTTGGYHATVQCAPQGHTCRYSLSPVFLHLRLRLPGLVVPIWPRRTWFVAGVAGATCQPGRTSSYGPRLCSRIWTVLVLRGPPL
jgi:hypothetical protein